MDFKCHEKKQAEIVHKHTETVISLLQRLTSLSEPFMIEYPVTNESSHILGVFALLDCMPQIRSLQACPERGRSPE
jgi:hypothetical protein